MPEAAVSIGFCHRGKGPDIESGHTDREIDAAFVSLVQERTGALLVGTDLFFNSRIEQLVTSKRKSGIWTGVTRVPENIE